MSQDPEHRASSGHHPSKPPSGRSRLDEAQAESSTSVDDLAQGNIDDVSVTPRELVHLGSPFAHTPAPADLIDLWDETERFFDALGDPNEFIEPEGTSTFADIEPIIPAKEDASSYLEVDSPERFNDPFLKRGEGDPQRVTHPLGSTSSSQPTVTAVKAGNPSSIEAQAQMGEARPPISATRKLAEELNAKRSQAQSDQSETRSRPHANTASAHRPSSPIQTSLAERFDQRHLEQAQLVVIAGGKGGVGRSLIAANLALCLAKQSRESVVIADLDPLGSNLHTYLGLEPLLPSPGQHLRAPLSSVIEQVPSSEVVLVRSTRPICDPLSAGDRTRFLKDAVELQPRWLIVDAGILPDQFTLELFVNAHHSLMIYTPDPSAVERGHAFLRAAIYRQLIAWGDDASVLARSLLSADHEDLLSSPDTLARALRHMHPEASQTLEGRLHRFCPQVIMNLCRTRGDQVSGEEICSVLKRKWRIQPSYLGAISHHHVAQQSLMERRPLTFAYPSAAPSLDLERMARSLIREAQQRELREDLGSPHQPTGAQEMRYG